MCRCEVWIDNSGLSHLKEIDPSILNKNYRLCSMHFEKCMFRNEQQNRLKLDAIPTLFESSIEKQTVENVADDDYVTVEDCSLPSCSTPGIFFIN